MNRINRVPSVFIVFVLTLALLFPPFSLSDFKAYALSIEDEQTLGREFFDKVRERFKFLEDDYSNRIINELGTYLVSPLETKPFPFHFYIIKDNTLNAFAAPGGNIFIFSGLIGVVDNMDELASVICHEIGHVSARHLSQRMAQSQKISIATMAGILAGVLLGGGALGGALMTGSVAAGIQAQLQYSREDERQADQLGFKYMDETGFDPAGMAGVLKKIEKENWLGTDKIPPYLLTHPSGPERMANLETLLSQHKGESGHREPARFRKLFPLFKAFVTAKSMEPSEAERLFKRDLEKNPRDYEAHLGLGIVYKEQVEYDRAVRHLETALDGKVDKVPVLTTLGETYQLKGDDRKAISVLEKALKIEDEDPSAIFLLAVSYENLEKYQEALRLLERLTSFRPVKDDVYYHLGICYGRLNMLPLAHYNLGLYESKNGQIEKAKFHFNKAEELAGNDLALRKKIKEEIESLKKRASWQ